MKKVLVLFVLLFSIIIHSQKTKSKLAVMEFEDRSEALDVKMLSNAAEYLRGEFISSGKYVVIAKERQEKAIIKQMKKESHSICKDKSCQIPLGQALSADTILRTTINHFGGVYTIVIELIDLAKEVSVKGAKAQFDGTEKGLMKAMNKIVVQIVGNRTKTVLQTEKTVKTAGSSVSKPEKVVVVADGDIGDRFKIVSIQYPIPDHAGGCATTMVTDGMIGQSINEKVALNKENNLMWQYEINSDKYSFSNAEKYCEKLIYAGHEDWRLPTISELRTLMQNCPTTQVEGSCEVKDSCLSLDICRNSDCEGCSPDNNGKYSVFGDIGWFWSSFVLSDHEGNAWYLNFHNGNVDNYLLYHKGNVRCVRNDSQLGSEKDSNLIKETPKEK